MKDTAFKGPYCCMKCQHIKDASEFPIRWDLVTPKVRRVCKDCRRKAQNMYRHGREELGLPEPAPLDLDGFLPWPTDARGALVASVGCSCGKERRGQDANPAMRGLETLGCERAFYAGNADAARQPALLEAA